MGEIVTIGDATLYLGDCRKVLADIEAADLGVTDPPYKLTTGGIAKSGKTMSGKFAAHNYANDGELVLVPVEWNDIAKVLHGLLKENADCYVMANDKEIFPARNAMLGAGFCFHNLLIWNKRRKTANRWYMKSCEFTLYLWKGHARVINNPGSDHLHEARPVDSSQHPTEKPVGLMMQYIENSSQPGDVVLDPFMGSGTTGVAALECGRRFIGCELERKYFDMACERISRALPPVAQATQAPLFSETGT